MNRTLPLLIALVAGCSGTTNVTNVYGAAGAAGAVDTAGTAGAVPAGTAGTAGTAGSAGQGGAGGAAPAKCCLSKASVTALDQNGLKVTSQVAPLSACACHLPCPYYAGYRTEEEIVSRSPSYDGGPVTQMTVDEFDGAEYVRTESLDASGTLLSYSQTVSQLVPACS